MLHFDNTLHKLTYYVRKKGEETKMNFQSAANDNHYNPALETSAYIMPHIKHSSGRFILRWGEGTRIST